MAKTKISEFSATPNNNTDIDSINIAEGCAPSGINDAIRELMAQLKDFQTGAVGDSFNGPVGTTTAAAGAFTTLAASSTVTLSGGTANGVTYLNGSKVLTSGSTLVFDGTNLGVGTSSPTYKLDVSSTSSIGARIQTNQSGAYLSFLDNGGINGYVRVGSVNNSLVMMSGNNINATLDSSGNLGLGVTPSAWNSVYRVMQLGTGASISGRTDTANWTEIQANSYRSTDGTWKYITTAVASRQLQESGAHYWYTAPSGTAGNAITFTQAMTLDASGNLGVGTSSPTYRFEVVGRAASAGTLYAVGSASAGAGIVHLLGVAGISNGFYIEKDGVNNITHIWNNQGGERMRLDSSGNLLVGTTSGSLGQTGLILTTSYSAQNASGIAIQHSNGSASGNVYAGFIYNGASIGSITQSGTTGVTYGSGSDYRLKDITGPVTGTEAKDFIMALQPKQGSWKADGSKFVGFVAHEFQEISPSSVSGVKDAVDEDGKLIIQTMQASSPEVMANLIAHIQNLEQRLAALEAA